MGTPTVVTHIRKLQIVTGDLKSPFLNHTKPVQFSQLVSITPILALSTKIRLGLPSGLLPSYFENKNPEMNGTTVAPSFQSSLIRQRKKEYDYDGTQPSCQILYTLATVTEKLLHTDEHCEYIKFREVFSP
jgi:hypothetical protein